MVNNQEGTNRDYIYVVYGHEQIYGFNGGGVERVTLEISKYNLNSILQSISKIVLRLHSEGYSNKDTQRQLVSDIFSEDPPLRVMILKAIREGKKKNWVIFHEQAILVLIKIALEYANKDVGLLVTNEEVKNVGNWLLILSDVCSGSELEIPFVYPKDIEREKLRELMARQHFFNVREGLVYRIARFHLLFRTISKDIRLNATANFERATDGVSFDSYVSFCFYLLVKWVNHKGEEVVFENEWFVCKNKYFEQTSLKEEEINRVLSILLLDIVTFPAVYSSLVDNLLNAIDVYEYNFLPLRKRPLIPLDDQCFVCVSPDMLADKATEGVYWMLLNYFESADLKKEKELLPSVWGTAFEKYACERLTEGFGDKFTANFLVDGEEKFDGLIEGSEAIFLLEMKYAHWSYKAKLSGNREYMLPVLNQILSGEGRTKGLGQIIRAIKELETKSWELPFLYNNKPFIPLIIVGETIPMDWLNRAFYEDVSKAAKSFYENVNVMPFIIFDTEELEIVTAIASNHGSDIAEKLMFDYSKMFSNRNDLGFVGSSMNFRNYLNNIGYSIPKNDTLYKVFYKVANDATSKGFPGSVVVFGKDD
ncbi:hypothetical protein KBA63_01090 [Candidatus Woesebacteria bacterium]|nr:hypothetical protein [Candidatus Woesebacteria bacterium]MBP9687439.1 hypothetical protein [Candidatus Woesebacteria bacterium]